MWDSRDGKTITEGWRALELFTDRVDACQRFCSYLNDDPPPSSVLVFHGDGGNGKSLLMRHLRETLCKRVHPDNWTYLKNLGDVECLAQVAGAVDVEEIPVGRLDFDQGLKEGYDALLELRRDLSGPKLRFPLFDFAIVTYLHKSKQLSREHLRSLFPADDLDFVVEVASLLKEVPGAGLFIKFGALLDRRFGEPLLRHWQRRGLTEEQVLAIQRMDYKSELLEILPELFAHDINAALASSRGPARVAFFFDTHEAFWGEERNIEGDRYFGRDEWLRRLVGTLDRAAGAVVIVAGREAPKWNQAPRFPVRDLEIIAVSDLSDADALVYLERAGVHQQELQARLVEDARVGPDQVHPYYLGLGADLVQFAEEAGGALAEKDLELPPGSATQGRKLVDRLLRYVGSELRDAVAAVSASRAFDIGVFEYLGGELGFNFERARFRILTEFSFVRRVGDGSGRYRIHDLLRRMLLDEDREEIRQRAHAALETYYRGLGDQGDDRALAEAIYHANRLDWEQSLRDWVETFESAVSRSRFDRCRALLGVRDEMYIGASNWYGRISFKVGFYYHMLSRYREARAEYEEAISAFDRELALAPDNPGIHSDRGVALMSLGELQTRLSRTDAAEISYWDSIAAFDRALALAPDSPQVHSDRGVALMSLGKLHAEMADHEAAETSYRDSIAAFDRALALAPDSPQVHSDRAKALRMLGELQVQRGRTDEAKANYRASIGATDRSLALAPDNPRVHSHRGNALVSLGELQTRLSRTEEAEISYRDSIVAFDRALALAPDSPRIHSNRGVALMRLGELQAQLDGTEEAETSYRDSIGATDRALSLAPDNPRIHGNRGVVLMSLGKLHAEMADHEAAETSYRDSIAAFDRALALAPDNIYALLGRATTREMLADLQPMRLEEGSAGAASSLHAAIDDLFHVLRVVPGQGEALASIARIRAYLSERAEDVD